MNFTVEIDHEQRLIKVHATGLLNQRIRKEILLSVSSHQQISRYPKVLIDLTEAAFDPAEPMVGALELTSYLRTIGIGPQVRLAFLYQDAEEHRKYFERVAASEGYSICYCRSLSEAMDWLG